MADAKQDDESSDDDVAHAQQQADQQQATAMGTIDFAGPPPYQLASNDFIARTGLPDNKPVNEAIRKYLRTGRMDTPTRRMLGTLKTDFKQLKETRQRVIEAEEQRAHQRVPPAPDDSEATESESEGEEEQKRPLAIEDHARISFALPVDLASQAGLREAIDWGGANSARGRRTRANKRQTFLDFMTASEMSPNYNEALKKLVRWQLGPGNGGQKWRKEKWENLHRLRNKMRRGEVISAGDVTGTPLVTLPEVALGNPTGFIEKLFPKPPDTSNKRGTWNQVTPIMRRYLLGHPVTDQEAQQIKDAGISIARLQNWRIIHAGLQTRGRRVVDSPEPEPQQFHTPARGDQGARVRETSQERHQRMVGDLGETPEQRQRRERSEAALRARGRGRGRGRVRGRHDHGGFPDGRGGRRSERGRGRGRGGGRRARSDSSADDDDDRGRRQRPQRRDSETESDVDDDRPGRTSPPPQGTGDQRRRQPPRQQLNDMKIDDEGNVIPPPEEEEGQQEEEMMFGEHQQQIAHQRMNDFRHRMNNEWDKYRVILQRMGQTNNFNTARISQFMRQNLHRRMPEVEKALNKLDFIRQSAQLPRHDPTATPGQNAGQPTNLSRLETKASERDVAMAILPILLFQEIATNNPQLDANQLAQFKQLASSLTEHDKQNFAPWMQRLYNVNLRRGNIQPDADTVQNLKEMFTSLGGKHQRKEQVIEGKNEWDRVPEQWKRIYMQIMDKGYANDAEETFIRQLGNRMNIEGSDHDNINLILQHIEERISDQRSKITRQQQKRESAAELRKKLKKEKKLAKEQQDLMLEERKQQSEEHGKKIDGQFVIPNVNNIQQLMELPGRFFEVKDDGSIGEEVPHQMLQTNKKYVYYDK